MDIISELDGAKVIKQTKNDTNKNLSSMFFEEKDGSIIEISITALAIAKYEDDDEYYIFMCDREWVIQDENKLASVEEALLWVEKNFDITEEEWL